VADRAGLGEGGGKSGTYPRAYNFRGRILKVLNFKMDFRTKVKTTK